MGWVWKAVLCDLDKTVAIKMLKTERLRSGPQIQRFLREARALSRFKHDHIVEVHDAGVEDGVAYLRMDYLQGEDLRAYFRRLAPLSPAALADLLIPVCSAMTMVHRNGVVHRDLKPDNIFLARDAEGRVVPKVLDFGIAKVLDDGGSPLTHTENVIGTPLYMSPEQFRSAKHIDARTDQYSLGVILYEGATHELPIRDEAIGQLALRVVQGDFKPPRELRPDLPEEFERVILRAMARAPAERFPSMRELGVALLPFASERTRVLYGDLFPSPFDATACAEAPSAPAPPALTDAATTELRDTLEATTVEGATLRLATPVSQKTTGARFDLRLAVVGIGLGAVVAFAGWHVFHRGRLQAVSGSPPGSLARVSEHARVLTSPPRPTTPTRTSTEAPHENAPEPQPRGVVVPTACIARRAPHAPRSAPRGPSGEDSRTPRRQSTDRARPGTPPPEMPPPTNDAFNSPAARGL
jgi:serine/threonine-protein kinase